MGLSRQWHSFNAAHLDQMGWLEAFPGAVEVVAADGVYDLAAIGLDPVYAGAPQVLLVEKPDTGELYYLSYRQPIGYDDTLSNTYTQGLNVHRFAGAGNTYFLESLADGETFSDGINEVAVTQLVAGGDYVTVQVTFGGGQPPPPSCVSELPTLTLSPSSQMVRGGSITSYSLELTNNDGAECEDTTFSLFYSG